MHYDVHYYPCIRQVLVVPNHHRSIYTRASAAPEHDLLVLGKCTAIILKNMGYIRDTSWFLPKSYSIYILQDSCSKIQSHPRTVVCI